MSKEKTKGITLIALVITIIVMLILLGVTVTVSLNGGLFTTAKQAEDETQIAQEKEQLLMAVMGALGEDGKVNLEKLDINLPEGFTGSNLQYTSKTGNVFKVSGNGSITLETDSNEDTGVTISPKKETYTVGEEVTIGNENFFVIADDTEKVTLLAKYNLNLSGTAQVNETGSKTTCVFSTNPYWTGADDDLNDNDNPDGAMAKAKTYGRNLGGTGRLMTKGEAEALVTNHGGIIYGTNIGATDGSLCYWFGSASNTRTVWGVYGGTGYLMAQSIDFGFAFGVRPVVEILKSEI